MTMEQARAVKTVVVEPTPAELAERVADRFLTRVRARTRDGRIAHICLTGGSMGGAVLAAVAAHPRAAKIDWSLVHFWWGDERFVARDDADRNSLQSRRALLDHIPVPAQNVHEAAAPDEMGLDEAAAAYAAELARYGTDERPWPSFAVCFLGVGPDGHIASLFPDRPEVTATDAAVLPV
ncbi:MAG: 6-phosphogluconolactonase, partial [Microbacterium sp.]|nr:6-phosphogluconolactonase [Microbacterium sp.]